MKLMVFNPEGLYIPDIAETFTLHANDPELKYYVNTPKWRVSGYMKPWTPPVRPSIDDSNASFHDILAGILDESNREFPDGEGGKTRLQWCSREEAVFIVGTGVAGTHRLLSKIVPGPYVAWSEETINEERESYKRLIGQVLY